MGDYGMDLGDLRQKNAFRILVNFLGKLSFTVHLISKKITHEISIFTIH